MADADSISVTGTESS